MNYLFDIETTGLNSLVDRILCISIQRMSDNFIYSFSGEDEKHILEQFFNVIKESDELISFNGDNFDFPFIIRRALIVGVRICDNFNKLKSLDLRKIVNGWKFNYDKFVHGKLRDWAAIFLINCETENGEKMKEYYEKKEWDKIKNHCEEDVKITRALYDRIKCCGLIE